jgi:hypothetical protein
MQHQWDGHLALNGLQSIQVQRSAPFQLDVLVTHTDG